MKKKHLQDYLWSNMFVKSSHYSITLRLQKYMYVSLLNCVVTLSVDKKGGDGQNILL